MRGLILILVLLGIGAAYWSLSGSADKSARAPDQSTAAIVDISLPDALSTNARIGKTAFEAKCAACHGINAVGQTGIAPAVVREVHW